MATLRSSLPSRLRHLLSGESAIGGPSVKLDSEPPPKVKAFIDKVIQTPLQNIAIPLSGFRWEYSKGNFHHWGPLFLHFDKYFKTYLSSRDDLLLSDKILEDNSPFPKHDVLQILHVMQMILENCPNKSSFDGLEHFKLLLASTDPDVLVAALETLVALVKITPSKLHGSGKLIGIGSVTSYLLSLAQGWGSKEEGLGLYSCIVATERTQEGLNLFPSDAENEIDRSQYRVGSTLYFEFPEHNPNVRSGSDAVSSKLKVIQIPDLHLQKEDDLWLMKQCVEQYQVPTELRFALLTRIRYAHAFRSPNMCRIYSRICLLAFIVLVQSSDASEELASFFANEPEYTNELIRIVCSEEAVPGYIRTHAMLALGAQLAAYTSSHERARVLSGSSISFVGGNRMILLNVLQKAILSLDNSNDPSSLAFVEALLQFYLFHVVSTSTTGSILRGPGMVPTFLPLLEDSNPSHIHLVCLAVKTLQKLMDYSSLAISAFKELGGVELLAQRLQVEVHRVISCASGSESLMSIGDYSKSIEQADSQKRLIKVLLKALGSAAYSPRDAVRSQNADNLPATLSLILGSVDKFGGDVYYSAVTVMSEMIHKDPTCFSVLHELGLPDAFLSSVVSGVIPSSKAITCVPNGLGAICLNAKGLESVKDMSALRFLVDVFTIKKYALAMNEAIVPLANAVEELLRHVSSLRGTGVDLVIEIINKVTAMGDSNATRVLEKTAGRTEMELDSEHKGNDRACSPVNDAESDTEEISNEQFMQLGIFHLMVLLHRMIENSETCRLFVEKSGIEALLKLLLRPSIVQSSEGMSIALHSTMVFKGFTPHHSAPLARAFCSSLRDHLNKVFAEISSVSGTFWLDSDATLDSGLFSSLFLVEFLLFLAASKDNRWVAALLTEFGSDSKDVVGDIGRLHREVLWQVALLEDSKHESKDVVSGSGAEPHQSEFSTSETGDQRFHSFRQILDPLLRSRSSSWSVESQFFDILNLYRDLGRTPTFQQRNVQGSSNLQSVGSQQVDPSTSSNSAGTIPNEYDRKRSYHTACCNMVRSLSSHITHLFQELGKTMLHPSRRRDDTLSVSTTSKSVSSSFAAIALDHLNFGGHESPSGSEASVSIKCRYFGQVIEFIDGILLERPDSCNTFLLICFYGHGVVQLILTTFEATSQLLSAVNRTLSTPMETDEKQEQKENKEDHSWIDGPLVSYGKLMDHIVTSSFILSPSTKHLLVQSLTNGDVPFPRDGEAFVKALQSMVLKAILPVWNHPHFIGCSHDFIATVISMIKHIYIGVEVKDNNSNTSSRIIGPPLNESTITTIVEMGFSRVRAEEALRQVGSNSVELAMEWLFSHPEETPEDDEFARALAMSLGKSESDTKEEAANDATQHLEEDMAQLPPVEELLLTCTRLLQMKESLAFPVRDLLVTICSQNDGQNRSSIISFVVDRLKDCNLSHGSENNTLLSALFHVIALVFLEDPVAREVALKRGLAKLATDLLSQWESSLVGKSNTEVPKWVTTAFLAVDRLLQEDKKVDSEIIEQLKKEGDGQHSVISIDEDKQRKLQSAFGSAMKLDICEQKRLIEVSCNSIRSQLPSETMHAVLQLCSTLTRNHSVAASFLDLGGLASLLSLPTSSLFPGFDSIAAAIIRHILEDPQTLQQAMESEIKHNFNRHSNERFSARNFLLKLNSVIARDPVIFMLAAQNVCQVEMVGDRAYIVLRKDREKDKQKEKEKDKGTEKEKPPSTEGKAGTCNLSLASPGSGRGKNHDAKCAKAQKKTPQSFINVVELLVDSIASFVPQMTEEMQTDLTPTDMDIDGTASKGKGKAVAVVSQVNEACSQETSTSLAKIVFILKLLTEILLMYNSSAHVLLRLDTEISSCGVLPPRASSGVCAGGLFHHVVHNLLPYARSSKKEKKPDGDWRHKLATRANQFLVAACVRSTEARKRVFMETNFILNEFVASCSGVRPPSSDLQAYMDLLNDVLGAGSPTASSITNDASATFIDVGLVKSLTRILQVLDLDHSDSPKVITGLIKALELVTKEHVRSSDSSAAKRENLAEHTSDIQTGTGNTGELASQIVEVASHSNDHSFEAGPGDPSNAVQTFGSEAVTDDMEHDQGLDGGFAPATEDDFMQDVSGDARENSGIDAATIRFDIHPPVQENIDDDEDDDDDDEMSGDDGDEVDEDEEDMEHNVLEEDEVHYLPHPDTDQDDHDMDDEFDEVLQEDDEDDEDDEDGVILRLEEGINSINVLDHIEVFNRDNGFSNETLQVMPVEVFGSRRQGRTTSIYNLLGRSSGSVVPSRHPLLVGPSSLVARQSDSSHDLLFPDRNLEGSPSRLDAIFRTLRNGRHAHQMNLWPESIQGGGSNAAVVPEGFEELLVSQLRRPDPEKRVDQNTRDEQQDKGEGSQLQAAEAGERPETTVENHTTNETSNAPPSSSANDASSNANVRPAANEGPRGTDGSSTQIQVVEMQFEQGDAAVRDVEAVSQESGGSGATLGESLRSLDVEIGSADGHDDGGERQGPSDRMPVGDLQATRPRRTTVSFGSSAHASGREASLHSVTEVSENSSREAEQDDQGAEPQVNSDAGSGSIDPAFLEALPEELRAEVLSSQQGQVAQPSNAEQQSTSEIDPEFLAALPPDIRAEVLAQQQAQRMHQSRELEGQPVEMDAESIIATFPSDLREEVLLTSSDAILGNLTPALVAEANMLRERFASRFHNRALFGMYPRSRRVDPSRWSEAMGSLGTAARSGVSRRSAGGKVIEADGAPLVDSEALQAMVRLLRVFQPLCKSQLQKLLLNLCAHSETRTCLVRILMNMLTLDKRKRIDNASDNDLSLRLYSCQRNVVWSRSQLSDGVPPLVSRRILETLTYLAKNHPYVAKILLQFRLSLPLLPRENVDQARGKAVMVGDGETGSQKDHEYFIVALILGLLNQPLYLRSMAHLEQLLNLLDVIIDNAGSKESLVDMPGASTAEQPAPQISSTNAMTTDSGGVSSDDVGTSSKVGDLSKVLTSSSNMECDSHAILLDLPRSELRLLCSLLAREGLPDNAYTLLAKVLKKLVVIVPAHCHLFITELANAVLKLAKSAMNELHVFGETVKALLSRTSSDGTTIVRVLQAVSSLLASITDKDKDQQPLSEEDRSSALSQVSIINMALEPLWLELSTCISNVERYSDSTSDLPTSSNTLKSKKSTLASPLPAGSQNILPYIESFFVTCEKLHPAQSDSYHDFGSVTEAEEAGNSGGQQKNVGSAPKFDERNIAFVKFCEKHRKLLNAFIRQNSGLLEKSFSLMLKVPRFIDFDNKRAHFRSKIKHQHDHHHSPLRISVRRAYILEDSYNQLRMRSAQELKGRLTVHFQGEEGIDAGGLTREWYQLLSRVIFDKGALLFTTVGNESTFQPNPNSVYQTEHLSYFKFVGRVVGKALFDGQLLDVHFTRSFYKHILEAKVTYHDIEAIDPDYYKNLKWMLENDISDVLDLTFSIDADEEKLILYERTEVTDYELIPGGRNIKVTEENKHQYVDLVAEHRLTTAIRPQINAFLDGFNDLITRELISIFHDKELELLISGLPDIDLDDLRANTEYSGYSAGSPVIQWFWEVVQSFSKEDKARLLQFVTGTSKVPLEGFSALQGISGSQKFQIHKAYGSPDHLPSAHTCFNQLDLPEYPSKEHLEERLLLAIHEANEGFGFG